jgi:lipoprotein-releasing system permease protein
MSFEWFVARRYLTARRRQAFISLISGVSIVGVAVGVMALIIALALMTGMQAELRDRIVGASSHVYVYRIGGGFTDLPAEMARVKVPGVVGVAPAIVGPGLLQSSRTAAAFVSFKGIDPALEPAVTDIASSMRRGSLAALAHRPEGAKDGVVLGLDLAETLHVDLGDLVWAVTAESTSTPFSTFRLPRQRPLEVVGIFKFGYDEVDTQMALVSLDTAASLLNREGPDMLELRLADMDAAPRIRDELQEQLGVGYQVEDWTHLNRSLYSALWLEKVAISLTIGLIVMVAALNIVASLVLLVMEKSRDIAILRTMGASARAIRTIFVLQGLTIGLVGTLVGATLGVLLSRYADSHQLIKLPSDVYQITYLPFHVEALDVTIVVVSAIAVCLLATIYPSRQAGRLDPAEALRNA